MSVKPLPYQPSSFPNPDMGGEGMGRYLSREFARIAAAIATPLIYVALATPNNANAAAAGVPVNGFYTDTANPAKVYVRTA